MMRADATMTAAASGDGPWHSRSALAVFLAGVLVSLTTGWLLQAREVNRQAAAIQAEVASEARTLQEHLLHLVRDVQVVTQFYAASETVTAVDFSRFVRPFLDRHPGLLALEWVPRVTDDQRADFEAAARAEGLTDFVIHDWSEGSIQPAPPRPAYFPVLRLASLNRALDHARALGFDLASEPRRRAAMERAAATGQPAVTPPLRLIQAPQGPPVLIVFAPLFADAPPAAPELRGFALGVIQADVLLNDLRSALPLLGLDRVLRAADADGATEDILEILPSRRRAPGAILDADALERDPRGAESRLTVADRVLILRGVPLPEAWPLSVMPRILAGAILLLSLTLALALHHRRRGLQRLRESEERLRHYRETALETERAHLEQRVAERTVELHQLADRLQLATAAGGIGVWEWDTRTNRLIWDARMLALYGAREGEFDGSFAFWLQRVHPEDVAQAQGGIENTLHGDSRFSTDFRIRWPDGSIHWIAAFGKVIRDARGEPRRMIGVNWDVTDHKQAREQAEQATRSKSAFLAHMSHEIRTPMNAIVGLSELTLRRAPSLDPASRDDLENLHRSALNLLGILDDILDQSKIEAGRLTLDPAPFALARLLVELRNLFAPTAAERGLILTLEADPHLPDWLTGDAPRLRQVLSNLLSNALKFTRRGRVALRVSGLARGADGTVRLRWTVADTGMGMDAATQARLFMPFAQGDDSITRRFGGTGLGLSISHALVEMMGGRLQVTSVPDEGSRFWFELTLPVAAAPVGAEDAPTGGTSDARGARILVAEDQPLNRRVIAEMLDLLGMTATLVADGQAALDRLAATPAAFDAVLLDIQMPVLDGLSATRRLRADPGWAALPVIALTAGVTAEERQRIQDAGMNDLIPKPVTLDTLSATLGRWLAGRARPAPQSAAPPSDGSDAPEFAPPPGFDLATLRTIYDADGIHHLLRAFADSVRDLPDRLAQALAERRFDAARADAHRLKGVSANVGAVVLAAAAERLEDALRSDAPPPPELLETLRRTHADALAAIAALHPAPPAAAPDPAAPLDTAAPWVLIVEDEPINVAFLTGALRDDCRILSASRGAEALALARGEPRPELILLDVHLPDLDGYAVCEQLQADPATAAIPVLFVTARDQPEDQARGFALGGVDYIVKPCSPLVVRARVRTQIRLRRQAELLERQAHHDALTGVANRRLLMATLERECRRAARDARPLSALLIDIDHFKGYNDHYGHGAGDICLRQVATALAQALRRPGDLLARHGGEEFVALLPDTDAEAARLLAERLRAAVLALELPHAASSAGAWVSVSIGGATMHPGPDDLDGATLLARADRQLYRAKDAGRDRSLVEAA